MRLLLPAFALAQTGPEAPERDVIRLLDDSDRTWPVLIPGTLGALIEVERGRSQVALPSPPSDPTVRPTIDDEVIGRVYTGMDRGGLDSHVMRGPLGGPHPTRPDARGRHGGRHFRVGRARLSRHAFNDRASTPFARAHSTRSNPEPATASRHA